MDFSYNKLLCVVWGVTIRAGPRAVCWGLVLSVGASARCRVLVVYSMVLPIHFLKFGEGALATYGPGNFRIVTFPKILYVLDPK